MYSALLFGNEGKRLFLRPDEMTGKGDGDDNWDGLWCVTLERMREERTHLAQLFQDLLTNALILKINPRRLDHLIDDLVVDVANRSVRHVGRWRAEDDCLLGWAFCLT